MNHRTDEQLSAEDDQRDEKKKNRAGVAPSVLTTDIISKKVYSFSSGVSLEEGDPRRDETCLTKFNKHTIRWVMSVRSIGS